MKHKIEVKMCSKNIIKMKHKEAEREEDII